MQGKVDIGKSNSSSSSSAIHAVANVSGGHVVASLSTQQAAKGALVKQPAVVGAVDVKPAPGAETTNATTSGVLSFRLQKNEMALATLAVTMVVGACALLLAFLFVALFVCAVYDLTANMIHAARFRSCKQKIQRAHAAFHSKTGELPLCPYCVEPLPLKRGPSKVVFLCGHRLHVECSNKWFSENPDCSTHCPICRDVEPILTNGHHNCCEKKEKQCQLHVANNSNTVVDGAFAFILGNLHRLHPQIVTQDCVDRWMTCNTEIWLHELKCPRYNSVLSGAINMVLGKQQCKA